jgi:hypothetical protein
MRCSKVPDSPSHIGGGRCCHSGAPVSRSYANRRRSGSTVVIGNLLVARVRQVRDRDLQRGDRDRAEAAGAIISASWLRPRKKSSRLSVLPSESETRCASISRQPGGSALFQRGAPE